MRAVTVCILTLIFWNGGYAGSQKDEEYLDFILNWKPPVEAEKRFPYYISGFDKDGSPVCVFEFGSWDVRSYVEKSIKNNDIIRRYTEQMFTRFHESSHLYGNKEYNSYNNGYIIIADLDQYSLAQITHFGSLQAIFNTAIQFSRLNRIERRIKRVYVVNANLLFRIVYFFIRPILGSLGSFVEIHGTSRAKWIPVLLKQISQDQLPGQLGGSLFYKPVQVYG